jgi:hypothetical protein
VRWLGITTALLAAGCATSGSRFEAGQVWRLKSDLSESAKLVVENVESRGSDTVVHAWIVNLPAHPRAAEAMERAYLFSPHPPKPEERQTGESGSFIIGGYNNPDNLLDYYGGSVEIDLANRVDGPVSIPHVAIRAKNLASAVTTQVHERHAPSPAFAMHYELWIKAEADYREINDKELTRPLSKTLDYARRQVDDMVESWLVPVPPAAPGSDEAALDDRQLAEGCREWTKVVIDQLEHEFRVTLLTLSPTFGPVWRGDHVPKDWKAGGPVDRVFCWLPAGAEAPKMAFGWALQPLIR